MLTPDDNNIMVFNKGNPYGFKTSMPAGGQIHPIATDGAKLQWKKAQKKPKKNITSEAINNIIPARKPFCTFSVWCPVIASTWMSLNQANALDNNNMKDIILNKLSNITLKLFVKEILCK
jgi:hypothetical protein